MRRTNLARLFALGIAALTAAGCTIFGGREVDLARSRQTAAAGTAGIKNVNQLTLAMSEVTGVAPSEFQVGNAGPRLSDHAGSIAPWLSPDGNVATTNDSMVLAITGMAGLYCRRFIERESAVNPPDSRRAHAAVNFAAGAAGLSPGVIGQVIDRYALLFWRREPTTEERAALTEAAAEAATEQSAGAQGSANAQRALLVPCTAVLASLEFLKS